MRVLTTLDANINSSPDILSHAGAINVHAHVASVTLLTSIYIPGFECLAIKMTWMLCLLAQYTCHAYTIAVYAA